MTAPSLRAPDFWWRAPGALSNLLLPAGALYGAIAARRLGSQGYRTKIPVVCIGNPTLGGAGKTPTAISVGKLLKAIGKQPFFLTRGYGGSERGPLLADLSKHAAKDVGDEALLLAAVAPTIIARDRAAGAQLAEAQGADVIVMDDGFQNPSLTKDFSVLVVDGAQGLGNGRVFPAGPLRAPLTAQLGYADVMLIIGEGSAGNDAAARAKALGLATHRAKLVADAGAVSQLKGKRLLAFAGIGDPEKFFRSLEAIGADVGLKRAFPDHHSYNAREAAELIRAAANSGLKLITTEKDRARMTGDEALGALRAKSLTLPVTLAFDDEQAFRNLLEKALAR